MTPLHEILARAEEVEGKATRGPWVVTPDGDRVEQNPSKGEWAWISCESQDAAFIALSRALLAPLIAVAKAADKLGLAYDLEDDEQHTNIVELNAALASLAAVRLSHERT